jgi:hypothetical protein
MTTMADRLSTYTTQSQMSSFYIDKMKIFSVLSNRAKGDGSTDDTDAIQDTITAAKTAGGGKVYFPYGNYVISDTLVVDDTIYLESDGATLSWYGGAAPMFTVGGNGTAILYRLGIRDLILDGRGLASTGLKIIDLQDAWFYDLLIKSCTENAVYITNTTGLNHPTGFLRFENLKIQLREGTTPNANGIYLDGKSSGGSEGVTLSKFEDVRIEHANGDGIVFGDYGDNMIFTRLFTYRDNAETGIGVHYISSIQGNCSNTNFINPTLTAGLKVDHPNNVANHGIVVVNITASSGDLNTGITRPIYGPGSADVIGFDSMGRTYGIAKVSYGKEVSTADRFKYINYDATNQFLYTNDGIWKTAIGAGGGIINEGDDGSSCSVVTQAVLNDIAAVYDVATLGASGIKATKNPIMMMEVASIDLANTKYRFGFMDAATDPPTNGVYVQGTAAGNWYIVCRKAGTETAVDTGIAIAVERRVWLIEVKSDMAIFYSKLPTDEAYTYVNAITTNIPTVALDTVFTVKALAAAQKTMRLLNYSLTYDLE